MKKHTIILLWVCFACLTVSAQISSDSLVLYLPLNGNANDISGNNYNGIVSGATLTDGFDHKPNSAYLFNGLGQSITIPNIKMLADTLTSYTVLIRLQPYVPDRGGDGATYTFIVWGQTKEPSIDNFLKTRLVSGWQSPGGLTANEDGLVDIRFWCNPYEQTSWGFGEDTGSVNQKWMSLAYVFNKGTTAVFYNCEKQVSNNPNFPPYSIFCDTVSDQIVIGAPPEIMFDKGYKPFAGKIDELRVYKRALSDDEIKLYADSICNQLYSPYINEALYFNINPCQPNEVTFIDTSTVLGTAIDRRKWILSTGDTSDSKQFTYQFNAPGNYNVQLNIYHGDTVYNADTVIHISSTRTLHFLKPQQADVYACTGASVTLSMPGGVNYAWSPCADSASCKTSAMTITAKDNVVYTIAAKDANNCRDTQYIKLNVVPDATKVFTPTAFTPNSDGHNDMWGVVSSNPLSNFELNIFNRWGQNVFATKNQGLKWDGTIKGVSATPGTYIWELKYRNADGCADRQLKGILVLIR